MVVVGDTVGVWSSSMMAAPRGDEEAAAVLYIERHSTRFG